MEKYNIEDIWKSKDAMMEGYNLYLALEKKEKVPDDLTDREVVIYALHQSFNFDFANVMCLGSNKEKEEAFSLMRKAIATGKTFRANRDEAEGVFESQKEMEEYMSQLKFHMDII